MFIYNDYTIKINSLIFGINFGFIYKFIITINFPLFKNLGSYTTKQLVSI